MSFRFAVIGDTHFCLAAGRDTRIADSFAVEPDYRRYAGMAENLERLGAMIAAERCELLISTGDLIEGGGDDAGEERVALEVLGKAAPAFFRAPGTHDGGLARAGRAYCAFDRGGCRFILLDYTRWNAEQREFLREALASAAGRSGSSSSGIRRSSSGGVTSSTRRSSGRRWGHCFTGTAPTSTSAGTPIIRR